jgi:hypothetical protein
MKGLFFLALIIALNLPIIAQAVPPQSGTEQTQTREVTTKHEELVREWFRRLNALNGSQETIDRFVELYHPEALLESGPSERQMGPVYYEGHELIRKWAADFSRTHVPIPETAFFAIVLRTVDEKTAEVFYVAQTPWAATGVAVEFTGRYIVPQTNQSFMAFGTALFLYRDGKIAKLRLYIPREEIREISPPFRP